MARSALLAAGAAALLAACSFDATGLSERVCANNSECPSGECLDGICLVEIGGDAIDAVDDLPDADQDGPRDDADVSDGADAADLSDVTDDGAETTSCEPLGVRCEGSVRVECSEDGEAILEDCADADDCDEFGCACTPDACVPRVCDPGRRACDGETPVTCAPDGSELEAGTPCGGSTSCNDGVCVPLECEPGTSVCSDGAVVVCDDVGEVVSVEDCLVDARICTADEEGARCVEAACIPGTRACQTGEGGSSFVGECNPEGTAYAVAERCDEAEVCLVDRCVPQICEPLSQFCRNSGTLTVCDDRGVAQRDVPCETGTVCVDAAQDCVERICDPGTTRCSGLSQVETCSADGTAWGERETCPSAQSCFDGECIATLCAPGAAFCDGQVRSQCSEDGLAVTPIETCPWGCSPPACLPSTCGDGLVDAASEACDDGNALSCDGCEACGLRSVLVSDAGVATTAGPRYVPATGDFTIEGWVHVTSPAGSLFGIGYANENDFASVRVSDGYPVFVVQLERNEQIAMRGDLPIQGAGWVHLAAVRFNQQSLALFVNGRLAGIHRGGTDRTGLDGTGRIWIGSDGVQTAATARIDEFRISSSRKYQISFAPQRRLANEADTVVLFHLDERSGAAARDARPGGLSMSFAGGLSWQPDDCYGAAAGRIVCGDGTRSPFELCDDGNTVDGDGCSGICTVETRCRLGLERPGAPAGSGCYVRNLTGQTWDEARTSCAALGGDLVTINDAGENDWLAANFGSGYWIGATDAGTWDEGRWRWASGQSFGFSAWASGEPNDGGFGRSEDCAEMTGGARWNDLACNTARWSVCEYGG